MPYKEYLTEVEEIMDKSPDAKTRRRILSQCRIGEKLVLKHRPILYDENAIEVYKKDGTQIGWLSQAVEKEIVKLVDIKEDIAVEIYKIDLGWWPFFGSLRCVVKIMAHFPETD